jgi:hypothetical protein
MSTYLPSDLRQRLLDADDHRCAYCQTATTNSGQPMSVDHSNPESKGGETEFDNLCFACRNCNEFKGGATEAIDPLTGEMRSPFHPRHHHWREHLVWDDSGTRIIGLTAIGRATVIALNMNNEVIVDSRRRWVGFGWHPPHRRD